MKTINNQTDKNETITRLRNLRLDSDRLWGKMTAHQMVCHLTDSFKGAMGEKSVSAVDTLMSRTMIKWIALRSPIKWPQGVKTRPEMDQENGGTKPVEFENDRRQLEQIIERFSQQQSVFDSSSHPLFGKMSRADWMRWGYRHVDHHLRQFGL
jgi:hypothetical protein